MKVRMRMGKWQGRGGKGREEVEGREKEYGVGYGHLWCMAL